LTGLLQPVIIGRPWQQIAIDVVGPLRETRNGNRWLVCIQDHFTKWPEAFATATHDFETIAKILVREIICRYGCPERLLSDRGGEFLSDIAHEVYKELKIQKVNTTSYHPQTDGLVERFNGTFVEMISMYVSTDQKDWDIFLPYCLFAYRTSFHPSINETPFFMTYGRDAKLPIEIHLGLPQYTDDQPLSPILHKLQMREYLSEAYTLAKRTMQIAAQKSKWTYDKKHTDRSFEVGDRVWVHNPATEEGLSSKLTHHWFGPLRITEKKSDLTYSLEDFNKKPLKAPVNIKRMKQFIPYVDPETDDHMIFAEETDLARQQEIADDQLETDEEYEIEKIVSHKTERDSTRYLVRWLGYKKEHDS